MRTRAVTSMPSGGAIARGGGVMNRSCVLSERGMLMLLLLVQFLLHHHRFKLW